jgi:hypothetical protein
MLRWTRAANLVWRARANVAWQCPSPEERLGTSNDWGMPASDLVPIQQPV